MDGASEGLLAVVPLRSISQSQAALRRAAAARPADDDDTITRTRAGSAPRSQLALRGDPRGTPETERRTCSNSASRRDDFDRGIRRSRLRTRLSPELKPLFPREPFKRRLDAENVVCCGG